MTVKCFTSQRRKDYSLCVHTYVPSDIDECDADPCDADADCQNFVGSFTCTCNVGFSGDGFSCIGEFYMPQSYFDPPSSHVNTLRDDSPSRVICYGTNNLAILGSLGDSIAKVHGLNKFHCLVVEDQILKNRP